MWYIILSIICIIVIGSITFFLCDDEENAAIITSFAILVVALAPIINSTFIGVQPVNEYQETIYTITGLESNVEVEEKWKGYFILGTGYLKNSTSSSLKYIYFANTEYGKQMKEINIDNVYIRETDDEEPKLIEIKEKQVRKTNWIDWLWGNKEEIVDHETKTKGKILVVPTNTIKIDYNIEV